ncbi:MAG: glycosyl transferase family protein [Pseudomonadota bacterium]
MSILASAIDGAARECMMLACVGFLVGGIDDLALDLVYWWNRVRLHADLRVPDLVLTCNRRLAIFVPAWDESDVIAAMLATTVTRFGDDDFRIYVGAYPNDSATIDAIAAVAERDPRIRLVVNPAAGPTTKADCLNRLWQALRREEAAEDWQAAAIVFHDAEDLVHRDELRVYRALLGKYQVVQLPVMPLVDPQSRLVAGHYIDEFAEAHGKQMVARGALGAPIPLAGVGCAIDRDVIGRVAAARRDAPFDADSLTEDYELGLLTATLGARQIFARVRDEAGGLVAVAEYFPGTIDAAVRQKARWMAGIALNGWDRVGWGRASDWRDHWMRMRDRRAPLAVLVLLAAYAALVVWGLSLTIHAFEHSAMPQPDAAMQTLLRINAGQLLWRLAMRMLFTARAYGPIEALLSLPRAIVANFIAMLAARRALWAYVAAFDGRRPRWDKTAHRFPTGLQP